MLPFNKILWTVMLVAVLVSSASASKKGRGRSRGYGGRQQSYGQQSQQLVGQVMCMVPCSSVGGSYTTLQSYGGRSMVSGYSGGHSVRPTLMSSSYGGNQMTGGYAALPMSSGYGSSAPMAAGYGGGHAAAPMTGGYGGGHATQMTGGYGGSSAAAGKAMSYGR